MIRAALIQTYLRKSKPKAIDHVLKLLKKAALSDSDIVCLPELWYTKIVTNFEVEFGMILKAAEEYSITIIPGAFLEKSNDDKLQISSPVISADGMISGRQFKIHPFGLQRKTVKAGTKVEIFDLGPFKFGIGICYDIVFPEVARLLARNGADIFFFPSKIRNGGIKPWHMYLQVRALENRIPIVAPNICGSNIYKGKSLLVNFDYDSTTDIAKPKISVGSTVHEQVLVMDIDLKRNRRLKNKRFKDFQDGFHSL